jgi:ATP-dependent helicase/nuclease subunit B
MKITFDPAFDQGYWPGPLAERNAVSGEIWVGPAGLLGLLETMTGLGGPPVPHAVRAAELVPHIRSISGFWSASAQVDPFGTAKRVLEWRDLLWMHGWHSHPVSLRLAQLSEVAAHASPGFPDRLQMVGESMLDAGNEVSQLTLFESRDRFNPLWQSVLKSLQNTGTTIIEKSVSPVPSEGDLAACKKASFKPKGDGSLQFLRPNTTGAAAHEAAAWLTTLKSLERTVIIGPDDILDQALHCFDLPTTGAGIPVFDNGLLQILPLTLAMGWNPPDPQRALELLMLPTSPIPRGIARKLSAALQEYPAVGSDAWNTAFKKAIENIDDETTRNRLNKRITIMFSAGSVAGRYPATEIKSRIDLLRSWAKGRMPKDAPGIEWHALLAQLENCQRIVDLSGLRHFTAPQIRRMLYDITEESGSTPLYQAQAGIGIVGAPECITGTAEHVIWWSFNQNAAPGVTVDQLTVQERKDLKAEGVSLPEPGDEAVWTAERWRRPLHCAARNLILVCARHGVDGEPQYPHPLWDELAGRIQERSGLKHLEREALVSKFLPAKRKRNPKPLPEPVFKWQIRPELMVKRPKESPSSLANLISCPFKWALEYLGNVRGGAAATLDTPENLEGWLIHEILLRVLLQNIKEPETAVKEAAEIFDKEGPRLSALFFQPGFDDIRAAAKQAARTAAQELFRMLKAGGFMVRSVEEPYSLNVRSMGIEIEGRPDLVLEKPDAVIDFKRGGVSYRQGELENGVGLQLAVYGHLVRGSESAPFPPVAYLMLRAGHVITVDSETFPSVQVVDGPEPKDTWNAVKKTFKEIWSDLENGTVHAPGNDPDGPPESQLTDGRILLEPCKFCSFGILCGQAFSEES